MQQFLMRQSQLQQDLVSASENAARVRQFAKTRMCKFETIGMCAKGHLCPFAHNKVELQNLPDLSCTKICKTLINTGKCDVPNCMYAHNREELRPIDTHHKTKLCRFAQRGHCSLGAKCNFAHSLEDLQPEPEAPPARSILQGSNYGRPTMRTGNSSLSSDPNAHGFESFRYYSSGGGNSRQERMTTFSSDVPPMPMAGMSMQDALIWQAHMLSGYPHDSLLSHMDGKIGFMDMAVASVEQINQVDAQVSKLAAAPGLHLPAKSVLPNDEDVMTPVGEPLRLVRSAEGRLDLLGACEDEEEFIGGAEHDECLRAPSIGGVVVDQTDDVWQVKKLGLGLGSVAQSISAVSTAEGPLFMLDAPEQW